MTNAPARQASLLATILGLALLSPAQERFTCNRWDSLRSRIEEAVTVKPVIHRLNTPFDPESASLAERRDRVRRWACAMNLDPSLLMAVIKTETNYCSVPGPIGERGPGQVRPQTANHHGLDASRLNDFDYGVYAAAVVLTELLAKSGNESGAIGAYHGGPNWQLGPPEAKRKVRAYVASVMNLREKYRGYACD